MKVYFYGSSNELAVRKEGESVATRIVPGTTTTAVEAAVRYLEGQLSLDHVTWDWDEKSLLAAVDEDGWATLHGAWFQFREFLAVPEGHDFALMKGCGHWDHLPAERASAHRREGYAAGVCAGCRKGATPVGWGSKEELLAALGGVHVVELPDTSWGAKDERGELVLPSGHVPAEQLGELFAQLWPRI